MNNRTGTQRYIDAKFNKSVFHKTVLESYEKLKPIVKKNVPKLNENSVSYLKSIWVSLQNAKRKSNSYMKSLKYNWTTELLKGPMYEEIPTTFQKEIESMCNHVLDFTITTNNRSFHFHFCKAKKIVDKIRIQKIITWLLFIDPMVVKDCSKTVDVYFYDINSKKQFNNVYTNEILGRHHINTAFTTSCNTHTNIYCFRKEENDKCFIHETCHNLGMDFLNADHEYTMSANAHLVQLFSLPDDLILEWNESYPETWGRICNSMLYALFYNPNPNPNPKNSTKSKMPKANHFSKKKKKPIHLEKQKPLSFHEWREIFRIEQFTSLFQCIQLLNANQLNYETLGKIDLKSYRENSHGISYFLLTSIFMFHLNDFLDYCKKNSNILVDSSIECSINISKSKSSIENYINMIETKYNDPDFTDSLARIAEKKVSLNSGRMSFFGAV
jgi:hypothetical protein